MWQNLSGFNNGMHKVQVLPIEIKGNKGYDIRVTDETATVQDYIDALETAFSQIPFFRNRNQVFTCEGCQHCCNERIPLTSIDVLQMMDFLKKQSVISPATTLPEFITRHAYVIVEDHCIDIMLRLRDDFCQFLNDKALCQYYSIRPIVCRTFFCCPTSKVAGELRETIVNTGEDELVRLWLTEITERNLTLNIDEAYEADPDIADWDKNIYTGKESYQQLRLIDLCTKKSWRNLINT